MKKLIFLSLALYILTISRLLSNEPIGGMYFSYYAYKDEIVKLEFNIAEGNITPIELYIKYKNRGLKEVTISCDPTYYNKKVNYTRINTSCNRGSIRQFLYGDINLIRLKKRSEHGIRANLKILRIIHKESFYKQLDKDPLYSIEDHIIYIKDEVIRKTKLKAQRKAEQEAKLKAEREAKLKAEREAKLKAEQEAKLKAEREAKLKIEAQREAKLKEERERPAKLKAQREAKLKAEQEAKLKAEREAKLKIEAQREAKLKAQRKAKLKAEREAKLKAEREAKLKAEQEAKLKAEQKARLRAEELKSIPGFRNIKPGMTSEEIWNEADCRINHRWNPCYGISNLKFSGKYSDLIPDRYLEVLYVDLGPIVDTYSLFRTFTEIMGEEPSNIYEKTLQSLNKKYSRNYSFNERDRQLFNENMINELLVVFSKGRVVLKIFRKEIDTYNTSLWLYVEYRNNEKGKLFLEKNKPIRETSDDF